MRCLPLFWLAGTLTAQTPLGLEEAVATAIRQHPVLQASEQRIRGAEGFRRQAGLFLNPRLVLQTENTRPYGPFVWLRDTDNFAYLQQTFETGGKRERRVDFASAGQRRAELERELIERQIANRVKQAYWQAAGAGLALRLLEQDAARFEEIIQYHQVRVTEGAIAEVDLIRVRVEGGRLAVSRNTASLDAERTRIALQREMAATAFPAVVLTTPLEPLPEVPPIDMAEVLDRRPEVRIARQTVEQARANLRLQQAQAKPNVDALFGYKRATGFDSMIGGMQVDLPFTNRNQGNIAAAVSEIRASESALAATEALVRAEVEAAQREVEIRRRQLGGQLAVMREQAAEAARIAEASYREGATDLLRFLDAQRLRIETQLLYTRTLAEYRQSFAVLEAALGVAP